MVDDLSRAVAELLVQHDPLEPWLTESHWDEDYWLGEATDIARRIRPGMDLAAVRSVVNELIQTSLPGLVTSDYAQERIRLIAVDVMRIRADPGADYSK